MKHNPDVPPIHCTCHLPSHLYVYPCVMIEPLMLEHLPTPCLSVQQWPLQFEWASGWKEQLMFSIKCALSFQARPNHITYITYNRHYCEMGSEAWESVQCVHLYTLHTKIVIPISLGTLWIISQKLWFDPCVCTREPWNAVYALIYIVWQPETGWFCDCWEKNYWHLQLHNNQTSHGEAPEVWIAQKRGSILRGRCVKYPQKSLNLPCEYLFYWTNEMVHSFLVVAYLLLWHWVNIFAIFPILSPLHGLSPVFTRSPASIIMILTQTAMIPASSRVVSTFDFQNPYEVLSEPLVWGVWISSGCEELELCLYVHSIVTMSWWVLNHFSVSLEMMSFHDRSEKWNGGRKFHCDHPALNSVIHNLT